MQVVIDRYTKFVCQFLWHVNPNKSAANSGKKDTNLWGKSHVICLVCLLEPSPCIHERTFNSAIIQPMPKLLAP